MKSELLKMNVQNFCRICLRNDKTLFGLFDSITPDIDSTSSDIFTVWKTFVRILKNTDESISLPDRICEACRNEILGAYSFARKCEKAKMICGQMKRVTVRLAKLKCSPNKKNLYNIKTLQSPIKKRKGRQFHIPLKAVKWAYNSEHLEKPNGLYDKRIELADESKSNSDDNIQEDSPVKNEEQELSERTVFKCEICNQTFAMKISYNRHIRSHSTQKGSIECSVCHARFNSQSVFEVHSFMHSVTKKKCTNTLNCSQCSRKFSSQISLDAHIRSHASDEKKKDKMLDEHRCDICNKIFFNARALSSHRHRHAKRNKCNICSKSFMTKAQLVNHLAHHKVMKPHLCSVCNKAFKDKLSLKDHLRSHNEHESTSSHLCSLCGDIFDNNQKYLLHMEINHKSKDCNNSSDENVIHRTESKTLSNTLDVPQTYFQYGCDICDARFPKHIDLIRHRRMHSNDNSHVCEICEKKFNLAYALKLHMCIHSDEKQLDCGLCGESFENDSDLCEHMKIHRSLSVQGEAELPEKTSLTDSDNIRDVKSSPFDVTESVK